jgi:hypothetical protein
VIGLFLQLRPKLFMSSEESDDSAKIISYIVACVVFLPIASVIISVIYMVWKNSIKLKDLENPSLEAEVGDTDTVVESEDTESFRERRIILLRLSDAFEGEFLQRDLPSLPNTVNEHH